MEPIISDVEKDDPARRALVNEIVGTTEELPKTIGEPGYRALAWFHGVDVPCVQVFTDDPDVSCEVNLDARPDWASSYLSIPLWCWLHDIPCFVVTDGQRFLIDMRPVG